VLSPSPVLTRRRNGEYRGLAEATWPIVRLGRGVQTETLGLYDQAAQATARVGDVDLVVTAAEARTLALIRPTSWSPVLAPGGVFAVITHADTDGERLNDPTGMLVRTARLDGLRYVDRIALDRVPMAEVRGGSVEASVADVSVRAHADLHVFVVDGDR